MFLFTMRSRSSTAASSRGGKKASASSRGVRPCRFFASNRAPRATRNRTSACDPLGGAVEGRITHTIGGIDIRHRVPDTSS